MHTQTPTSNPISTAYEHLALAGGNPLHVDEPFRTIVLADTALGLIDNGGVEHLFESDFPGCPEYGAFASAFRNLGLAYLADGLSELVQQFPFESPHNDQARRRAFLSSPSPAFISMASRLNERVWQDSSIDDRLRSFGSTA